MLLEGFHSKMEIVEKKMFLHCSDVFLFLSILSPNAGLEVVDQKMILTISGARDLAQAA